jgi:hypothetical protein
LQNLDQVTGAAITQARSNQLRTVSPLPLVLEIMIFLRAGSDFQK